uniref:Secreted protein n=1 Tax=Ascaris lumbricoides TaxID=6252 RepID=A0A0M3HVQ0_ASCLU
MKTISLLIASLLAFGLNTACYFVARICNFSCPKHIITAAYCDRTFSWIARSESLSRIPTLVASIKEMCWKKKKQKRESYKKEPSLRQPTPQRQLGCDVACHADNAPEARAPNDQQAASARRNVRYLKSLLPALSHVFN